MKNILYDDLKAWQHSSKTASTSLTVVDAYSCTGLRP